MTNFHDVRFPVRLAFGASGGPRRRTQIVQLQNGAEVRNTSQYHSRRQYNASTSIKSRADVTEMNRFFELRRGQLHAFRFKDGLDFSTASEDENISAFDQVLGFGDGNNKSFLLIKTYQDGHHSYERRITKPVAKTFSAAVSGRVLEAAEYSLDALTGILSLAVAPAPSAAVTAGFEFDVAVRFDTDFLDISFEDYGGLQISDIPLIEVLDHAKP